MSLTRLGKMHLRWCDHCNLPILEQERCDLCQGPTRSLEVTPPGDIRPGFEADVRLIRKIVDRQFGEGCGLTLLPEGKPLIMNKIPGLDRMDEVIIDGAVAGTLRYDLGKGYAFVTRMSAARALQDRMTRGYAIVSDDALEFILKGLNLLVPGLVDVHPDVRPGDEIIVLTEDRKAVCTGTARMSAEEMKRSEKGMAVKTRWFEAPATYEPKCRPESWRLVISANWTTLAKRTEEAVRFIQKTIQKNELPAMVSFSGGKDSLACLLLTLDAGLKLPIFFVDTGLEFPETIAHVHRIAEKHGLKLILESAPNGIFYESLAHFGPPGRDFRWCCKTNKLGPTTRAIMKHYPNGVLSFIGQRRYESEQRSEKPRVWRNPWTPGQIGASPIQDWTALHVWLYIFSKGEEYNPWYDRGLDRIGCILCPASDLSEIELVNSQSDCLAEWTAYLQRHASESNLPASWGTYALWRWKLLPDSIRKELERIGVQVGDNLSSVSRAAGQLSLRLQEGFSPCIMGFSVEGAFNRSIELQRAAEILSMLGPVQLNQDEGWLLVDGVRVFQDGILVAKGKTPEAIKRNVERVRRAMVKAEECVGCGVCIARCNEGALMLEQGRIRIVVSRCVHCGGCIEPCPAISFGEAAFEL
ncbi:MAG: phosphoadenosine phosphosulfate reductase family protein [Methanomassiliicoccales archaeon]|nr:phosphoadenosine phosphosulfate reductase family protein [Methanomassiliicoccales archaeon]